MSVRDGYGPAVSLGVTAQLALVDVVVVVVVVVVVDGLVGDSLQATAAPTPAAPRAPSTWRRVMGIGSGGCEA